jgi:hypothetical protein
MKRAGRWLFNFAAAVSLLLCIALVVLGIRSFWKVGSLAIDHRGGTRFWVDVERGQLELWKQRRLDPATGPAGLLVIETGTVPAGPTNGRPQNVITESVLGFGAKALPQASRDAAVASLVSRRRQADMLRDEVVSRDKFVRYAQSQSQGTSNATIEQRQQSANSIRSAAQRFQSAADQLAALPYTDLQVTAPMWALVAMTLILPMVWVIRWRRQRVRAMFGMCAVCGYDLRATPNRCPECGEIPEGAKGAAT